MSHPHPSPPSSLPPPADEDLPRIDEVRSSLDGVLIDLRGVKDPKLPMPEIERALGLALEQVYVAMGAADDWRAFRTATQQATEHVREALARLMSSPTEDPVANGLMGTVAGTIYKLSRLGFELPTVDLPGARSTGVARATVGVPRLIDAPRSMVRPAIPIDEPPIVIDPPPPDLIPAPPRSLAEVLALAEAAKARLAEFEAGQSEQEPVEVPRTPALPDPRSDEEALRERFGVAVGEHELLVERARDCLDDLAGLLRMRRATELETWASGETSERRLLTKVDAIVACGAEVFPELVRMLDDRPLPDPELTCATVFFFGCLAGDDAFDQLLRLVRVSDLGEPEMLIILTDALVLSPHPRVDAYFPRWLTAEDPNRRALAVEVLRRRRTLAAMHLDLLARESDPRVLASAVRALPTLIGQPPAGFLGWSLSHSSELVVEAALETAMLLRSELGYLRAADLVQNGRGDFARAILYVGIAGGRDARRVLEDEIASEGYANALRALGWYGDATFVPFLLGRLRDGDDAAKSAALEALERITGASIVDAKIVPEYERGDEPFVRPRRDYEPPGLLDGTPDAWDAWWKAHRGRVDPNARYRWGHVYGTADDVRELRHGAFLQRDRPFAAMELAIRGRRAVTLDWQAFVVKQREMLG